MIELEPGYKVWQPQGFEGLEIEFWRDSLVDDFPVSYVSTYEFTLMLRSVPQRMTYLGSRHLIEGTNGGIGPLLVQHPHSTVGTQWLGERERMSGCTVRISEAQFEATLRDYAGAKATLPCFRTPVLNAGIEGERLPGLVLNAVTAFSQPVSHLEREESVLRLVRASAPIGSSTLHSIWPDRPEHSAVSVIKNHLQENYAGDVTLDDLARLTQLNKFYLLEVFKRMVGVSPHLYQTAIRLHWAKRQLIEGLPLAEVAYSTGFVDQSHLNRQFKKHVRVTPGQFQRDSRRES